MSDNYIETKGSVILIKITPYGKLSKKWFWYKRLGVIRGKLGTSKPYCEIDTPQRCKENILVRDREEMQIGDTCLVKFLDKELPEVIDVIGIDSHEKLVFQKKNYQILRDKNFEDFVLISDNTKLCLRPPKANLIDARSNQELEFFEKIYYLSAVRKILENMEYINMEISSQNFIFLHKRLFENIYSWAGKIRKNPSEELVIGDRNHPTLEPEKVELELDKLFLSLPIPLLKHSKGTKRNLAVALADLHGHLAWIHPFIDGNGRTIRLFCELIALHYGYRLDAEKLTKANRSYYNFAIRRHIKKHPKHLIEIFENAMIEI